MERRIAVIIPGGVQREQNIPALVGLLSELSKSNNIHLYSFSDGALHPSLERPEVHREVPPKMLQWSNLLSLTYFFFKIQTDHSRYAFSMLHSFWIHPAGLTGLIANMILKIPFVLTLPGGDTVYLKTIKYGGMRSPFHRAVIRWCCRRVDRVTILSRYQESIMKTNRVCPKITAIIPFGVDIKEFPYRPKELSFPLRLVSVGDINRVKDIFLQIETMSILRRTVDCRLTIVGTDQLKGMTREYARALGVDEFMDWAGGRPHSEIPAILQSCQFLLHTSMYDAQAVVVMEAFATGTAVVGTRVGTLSDMEGHEAFTVSERDPSLLAEKILQLIGNPEKIDSIRKNNRTYAKEHSIEWTAAQFQKLYQEMIATA